MRKTSKSIVALLVSLMVVMALMVPAFATGTHEVTPVGNATALTEGATADITVATGNKGDTLNLYRVVRTTYDASNNTLSHVFSEGFQNFLNSIGEEAMTVEEYAALETDSSGLKDLLGKFTAYVKAQTPSVEPYRNTADNADGATDGVVTFTDVDLGQYIVVGAGNTTGALIYQTVTAEVLPAIEKDNDDNDIYVLYDEYSVVMKVSEPDVEKDIVDGTVEDDTIADEDKDTAAIGDTLSYELKITVPTYPAGATNKTFFIGDTLSNGLKLDPASIKVTGYTSDEDTVGTALTAGTAYTADTSDTVDNGGTFFVDFKFDEIAEYAFVVVEYEVEITNEALIGTDEGNINTVTLIYSNNPYNGDTWDPEDPEDPDRPNEDDPGYGNKEDDEVVYTYAIVIDKFEKDNETVKLANATFEIYRGDVANGDIVATITTDADGYASYAGLEAGTYYLKEVVAPTGYNLALEPFEVILNSSTATATITKTTTSATYTSDIEEAIEDTQSVDEFGVLLWVNAEGDLVAAETQPEGYLAAYLKSKTTTTTEVTEDAGAGAGYYKADIENDKGITVPGTGGIGTTIFYVVGGLLMVGALIVLVTKRRMRATSN